MPYTIRKQKCKQSDGDSGSYTLSYTDNKGKKHKACHTSRKKAQGQIAAIERPKESHIHSAVNETDEKLVREAVCLMLLESSSLSPREMKSRPVRWKTFLDKINTGTLFMSSDGTQFMIPKRGNRRLIAALQAEDPDAYRDAFRLGIVTDPPIDISTPNEIMKTAEFGGRPTTDATTGSTVSENVHNEEALAASVKRLVEENGPITVVLGKYRYRNVIDARRTGAEKIEGQTSKADIVMTTSSGKNIGVSIKMETAAYYLSGDAILAPIVAPIVKNLLKKRAPNPRVELVDDSYMMLTGPNSDSTRINFKFDIDPKLAQFAVFGAGANSVDIIVKGDLTKNPSLTGNNEYTWDVLAYKDVKSLPAEDQPVGLLRAGEAGRGFTYDGVKYSGLRPAIASSKRAKRALSV